MEKTLTAQRIRQIRRSFDWTQEGLAEKCGVNRVTVSSWENGKYVPEGDSLVRLARVLNVSTDYLMGRTDQPEGTKKSPAPPDGQNEGDEAQVEEVPPPPGYSNDIIRVPVYDDIESACAGYGLDRGYDESEVREFLDVPAWLLGGSYSTEPGRRPYIVTVYGDSMAEANIPDGCKVLINPIAEAGDGDVVVAELDGRRMVKWIYWDRGGDGGELRSSSSRYPARRFTREDVRLARFRCLGKVCQVLNAPTRGE